MCPRCKGRDIRPNQARLISPAKQVLTDWVDLGEHGNFSYDATTTMTVYGAEFGRDGTVWMTLIFTPGNGPRHLLAGDTLNVKSTINVCPGCNNEGTFEEYARRRIAGLVPGSNH